MKKPYTPPVRGEIRGPFTSGADPGGQPLKYYYVYNGDAWEMYHFNRFPGNTEVNALQQLPGQYRSQRTATGPHAGRRTMHSRTFTVTVWHARQRRNVGYPPLSGSEAVKLMTTLTRRGKYCRAITKANGITEILTLEELQETI